MTTEILCTLGPSSMNERIIKRLEELNVSLLRINLSHTLVTDVAETIHSIQKHTSVPICLDTEGAQIRTGDSLQDPRILTEHSKVVFLDLVIGLHYWMKWINLEIIEVPKEWGIIYTR